MIPALCPRPSMIRIPVPNPLTGSDDEPVDSAIAPWLRLGYRIVCTDPQRGLYEARKPAGVLLS